MSDAHSVPALGSLLRKAATDAGFDLEPERDGDWWRLRASGAPGVAWIRGASSTFAATPGALLALPLASQLAELALPEAGMTTVEAGPLALPVGAAGAVRLHTPEELHRALRRVWVSRNQAPLLLCARWEREVAAALGPTAPAPGTAAMISADEPLVTEAVAEVKRRVGQELYREALLDFWEGRCAVTGLAVAELLRASHAKPWADATDAERLDVHNGLLLAVHLDALFDRGLLTFDDDGKGRLSSQVSSDVIAPLGLSQIALELRQVVPAHLPYLAYHRTHVFRP